MEREKNYRQRHESARMHDKLKRDGRVLSASLPCVIYRPIRIYAPGQLRNKRKVEHSRAALSRRGAPARVSIPIFCVDGICKSKTKFRVQSEVVARLREAKRENVRRAREYLFIDFTET